jgi:hypothetical protein
LYKSLIKAVEIVLNFGGRHPGVSVRLSLEFVYCSYGMVKIKLALVYGYDLGQCLGGIAVSLLL